MKLHAAAVCATAWVAACAGGSPTAPTPATGLTPLAASAEWATASPASEGFDTARLEDVVSRIRRGSYGSMSSLLVVRNDRLVVEEYFGGMTADRAHTQQSVSKSVTALLVGLAVRAGRLTLDDQAARFFPQYEPFANDDARKRAVTVGDLLTMRSGLDWNEDVYAGSPLERMNTCACDWIRFVLDWRMRDPPGTRFEYISGGTILLGAIVGAATGDRLDRFADATLFEPLGVTGTSWSRGLPDGLPHAGGGLLMRPRDMAKIGLLVLDDGQWHGQQLIDASWIRLMTTRVSRAVRTWSGRPADYGYGWWMFDYPNGGVIAASGARGQWIFVVPAQHLVMTATGNNDSAGWVGPLEILFSYVLPALP